MLERDDTEVLFVLVLEICFAGVAPQSETDSIFALYSLRFILDLADTTVFFSRLPCFEGRHRSLRLPRSCITHWLPSLNPLSSRGNYTCILGVSRRSWY